MLIKKDSKRGLSVLSICCGLVLFSGCVVGPDYNVPDVSLPNTWNENLDEGIVQDSTELAQWWVLLEDPLLNRLIEDAGKQNLDLKEAYSRVIEARARRGVTTGQLFPKIDATSSYKRFRNSQNTLGSLPVGVEIEDQDLYSGGFDTFWEIDLFGRIRRSIEAANADLEASAEDYQDILITVFAEVARNYVEVRSFQRRLFIAEKNLEAQRQSLQLAEDRVSTGISPALDVAQAKSNLADTESVIPGLRVGLQLALNRLAVLVGENPGVFDDELKIPKQIPSPPKEIGAGIPADLVRQRPDIRRAERQLEAQTARIGVATAELYPMLSLSGSFTFEADKFSDIAHWSSRTFGVGPSFRWNIFEAGKIRNNIKIEDAQTEQALIRYEKTILNALEEVENSLLSYIQEQVRKKSLKQAVDEAERSVSFAQTLYKEGETDFQNVLDAQRSLLSLQSRLAESEGIAVMNLISLYKALGGGWRSESNSNFKGEL